MWWGILQPQHRLLCKVYMLPRPAGLGALALQDVFVDQLLDRDLPSRGPPCALKHAAQEFILLANTVHLAVT
jgi:hypothetical protein